MVANVRRNGLDAASDAVTVMVGFGNGTQGTIAVSMVVSTRDPLLEKTISLYGEAGSLTASFGLFR